MRPLTRARPRAEWRESYIIYIRERAGERRNPLSVREFLKSRNSFFSPHARKLAMIYMYTRGGDEKNVTRVCSRHIRTFVFRVYCSIQRLLRILVLLYYTIQIRPFELITSRNILHHTHTAESRAIAYPHATRPSHQTPTILTAFFRCTYVRVIYNNTPRMRARASA